MELYNGLNKDVWTPSEPTKHEGFIKYTMIRPQPISPGIFKYAIKEVRHDDVDCKVDMVTLDGASGKQDPLANIRNFELLIKDGNIVGVCVDDECVVKKNLIQ